MTDPRTTGVAQAAPRTAAFMARNWATTRDSARDDGSPAVRPSIGLAAQVLLDEVLISAMRNPKLFPRGDDYRRAGDDMRSAFRLWEERGWLENPERYHSDPPVPAGVMLKSARSFEQRYEHLSFSSGYHPHDGEPGRDRWIGHVPNRTAHVYLLRHDEPGRPWLVCLHGFGMGQASMDLRGIRAPQLHRGLGMNLAMVVLPLHGPRQDPGTSRGEGFMSIDLIDSVHGMAQAAYDARSAIRWIRATSGDVPVGVYGISLGAYVASLVASLEPDLACVIAGIPATDIPDLYRRHGTPAVRRRAVEAGALGPDVDSVHRVVSPLVLAPKPPRQRRFIFAGVGDRMSTAEQATRLWEHWNRPKIAWYPGSHIGFFMASSVSRFLAEALRESGLAWEHSTAPASHGPAASGLLPAGSSVSLDEAPTR